MSQEHVVPIRIYVIIFVTLVVLYFMHVRFTSRLTQIAAASGFAWLMILIGLTLSDVLTRPIVR